MSSHTLQRYEALNGLQEDTNSKSKEESAVEECTQHLKSLPSERQALRRIRSLGYLQSSKCHNEPDQVIQL